MVRGLYSIMAVPTRRSTADASYVDGLQSTIPMVRSFNLSILGSVVPLGLRKFQQPRGYLDERFPRSGCFRGVVLL